MTYQKEPDKLGKTKWDKTAALLACAGVLSPLIIDNFHPFFVAGKEMEIRVLLVIMGAFSFFYFVLSFFWDIKFNKVYEKISHEIRADNSGVERKLVDIKEYIRGSLTEKGLIESRILLEKENDLKKFLNFSDGSYARIFVITNSATVEIDDFSEVIRKNILDNQQYVYITPFAETEFIANLKTKLFGDQNANFLLEAAFRKNIQNIRDASFFELMPMYTDIVIYTKKELFKSNLDEDEIFGYYCFQNGAIKENDSEFYYYTKMHRNMAEAFIRKYQGMTTWDSVSSSWISPKLEKKKSNVHGDGMFCKEDIKKGEVLFRKGGIIIRRGNMEKDLLRDNSYLQIDDDHVLCARKPYEDMDKLIKLYINHSCNTFNCGMSNEIEFIAIKDIKQGEEILIDYGFLDSEFSRFNCHFNCSDCCKKNKTTKSKFYNTLDINFEYLAPYLKDRLKKQLSKKTKFFKKIYHI